MGYIYGIAEKTQPPFAAKCPPKPSFAAKARRSPRMRAPAPRPAFTVSLPHIFHVFPTQKARRSGLLPFPFRTFSTSSPRKKPAEAGFFVIASLLARVLDIRLSFVEASSARSPFRERKGLPRAAASPLRKKAFSNFFCGSFFSQQLRPHAKSPPKRAFSLRKLTCEGS